MEYKSVVQPKPLKIILIDDSEADYRLARECLTSDSNENYALDWSNSSEDGLKKIQSESFDLCIMDYRLGKESGVDLAHRFRENGFDNPIIMISGSQLTELKNDQAETPFEGFISKNNMSRAVFDDEINRLSPRLERERQAPQRKESTKPAKTITFDEKTVSQLIVENLPDPILLMDSEGNIVMTNKVFTDLMGMDSDEILGVNACLFMNCGKEEIQNSIQRSSNYKFRSKIKKPNGQGRNIYWKIAPIDNPAAPGIKAIAQGSRSGSGKKRSESEGGIKLFKLIKTLFSNPAYLKCNNIYINRRTFF